MLTLYSKSACPNCVSAKSYLNNLGIDYNEINIEDDPSARDFLLHQGHRSVPQIYNNDHVIPGGWLSLQKMSKEQILQVS